MINSPEDNIIFRPFCQKDQLMTGGLEGIKKTVTFISNNSMTSAIWFDSSCTMMTWN